VEGSTLLHFWETQWLTIVTALGGAVLAVYLYARGNRRKQPKWVIVTGSIIEEYQSVLPGLEVLYRDAKIDSLAVSNVAFWNAGRETIDGTDIAPADLLRIEGPGSVHLLAAGLVATNNDASRFSVRLNPERNKVIITFDFLDQNQGGVIAVAHTRPSKEELLVRGTIKGSDPLKRHRLRDEELTAIRRSLNPIPLSRGALSMYLGAVGFSIILVAAAVGPDPKYDIPSKIAWPLLAGGVLCIFLGMVDLSSRWGKGLGPSSVPRGLEAMASSTWRAALSHDPAPREGATLPDFRIT
jgi:hypothetical protein